MIDSRLCNSQIGVVIGGLPSELSFSAGGPTVPPTKATEPYEPVNPPSPLKRPIYTVQLNGYQMEFQAPPRRFDWREAGESRSVFA